MDNKKAPVDYQLALKQWQDYVETFKQNGWKVIEVPEAPTHPDGVFIEDVVIFYKGVAVITRPGAESRMGEIEGIEEFLNERIGCKVQQIQEPGTLDGGDILKVKDTIFVGVGNRTN